MLGIKIDPQELIQIWNEIQSLGNERVSSGLDLPTVKQQRLFECEVALKSMLEKIYKNAQGLLSLNFIRRYLFYPDTTTTEKVDPFSQEGVTERLGDLTNNPSKFIGEITVLAQISECYTASPSIKFGGFEVVDKATALQKVRSDSCSYDLITSASTNGLSSTPIFLATTVCAEPIRAKEIGEERLQMFLDFLQYTVAFMVPWMGCPNVNFNGLAADIFKRITAFDHKGRDRSLSVARLSPVQGFGFTDQSRKILEVAEHQFLVSLITKDNPTKSEKNLLSAVHWFAAGMREINTNMATVNMVQSLESLFSERDFTKQHVCNRVVQHLKSHYLPSLLKFIKNVYDIRSAIAHGRDIGSSRMLSGDVDSLAHIAANAIYYRLKTLDTYPDHDDYLEFLDGNWKDGLFSKCPKCGTTVRNSQINE